MSAVLLIALAALLGWSLVGGLKLAAAERLALGLPLGSVLLAYGWLAGACVRGRLGWTTILPVVLATTAIALLLARRATPDDGTRHPQLTWLVAGLSLPFVPVFARQFTLNPTGLWATGQENAADGCLHLTLIHSFVHSQNFWPQQPLMAEEPLRYHFLADFLSAVFMSTGATLTQATAIPGCLWALSLAALLYFVSLQLVGDRSTGLLACVLVFLVGSKIEPAENLYLGNLLTQVLLPQRALLFGLPVLLGAYLLLLRGVAENSRDHFVVAGVLAGLLPLVHLPSLLVLLLLVPWLVRREQGRLWGSFLVVTATLATAPTLFLLLKPQAFSGLTLTSGWMSERYEADNIVTFWWKNAGLMVLLLVALPCVLERGKRSQIVLQYLPFGGLFLLANLVQLAPNPYDNGKLLYPWLVFSSIYVAHLLVHLFRAGGGSRVLATLLALILIFPGLREISRWFSDPSVHIQLIDSTGLELARYVLEETPPKAIFLVDPSYNHPVPVLTGRRVFLGYPRWLTSYGYEVKPRQLEQRRMLRGGKSGTDGLFRHQIDYVVTSAPDSRAENPVFENLDYQVFKIR